MYWRETTDYPDPVKFSMRATRRPLLEEGERRTWQAVHLDIMLQ